MKREAYCAPPFFMKRYGGFLSFLPKKCLAIGEVGDEII
jgi:hypothetical protein